jgi:hypothetical protein
MVVTVECSGCCEVEETLVVSRGLQDLDLDLEELEGRQGERDLDDGDEEEEDDDDEVSQHARLVAPARPSTCFWSSVVRTIARHRHGP